MTGIPFRRASAAGLLCSLALLCHTPPAPAATFDLPSIDRIVNYQPKLPLQIFTADGVEIAQFGTERRIYVPLAKPPNSCKTRSWLSKTRGFGSTRASTPKAWPAQWWRP
ncbi:MAG: hypothetical protein R3E42_10030 [Burkholderiaceae bacterium]